jgi:peptide/nickel transport system ATP-binding protein
MTSLNPVKTCGIQVAEAIVVHKKNSNTLAKQQTIQLFEKVKLPEPQKIFLLIST